MNLSRVKIQGPLHCAIWQGATTKRGYPVMRLNGKVRQVRRVVYEREKRELLPDERVETECGERLCVLAAHLSAKPRSSARSAAFAPTRSPA